MVLFVMSNIIYYKNYLLNLKREFIILINLDKVFYFNVSLSTIDILF